MAAQADQSKKSAVTGESDLPAIAHEANSGDIPSDLSAVPGQSTDNNDSSKKRKKADPNSKPKKSVKTTDKAYAGVIVKPTPKVTVKKTATVTVEDSDIESDYYDRDEEEDSSDSSSDDENSHDKNENCEAEVEIDDDDYDLFEAEEEDTSNQTVLSTKIVNYIDKKFKKFIPMKIIKEKILDECPPPVNIQGLQIPEMDEYVHDIFKNTKKPLGTVIDANYKKLQEFTSNVMGPLSKLWAILDNLRKGDDDEQLDLHQCLRLMEQTVTLLGQVQVALAYQRRNNALFRLTGDTKKVKKLLKDYQEILGNSDTLFGDKFHKELQKLVKTKKSSVEIARQLAPQKSGNGKPQQQPFRKGPPSDTAGGQGKKVSFFRGGRGSQRGRGSNRGRGGYRGRGNGRPGKYISCLRTVNPCLRTGSRVETRSESGHSNRQTRFVRVFRVRQKHKLVSFHRSGASRRPDRSKPDLARPEGHPPHRGKNCVLPRQLEDSQSGPLNIEHGDRGNNTLLRDSTAISSEGHNFERPREQCDNR